MRIKAVNAIVFGLVFVSCTALHAVTLTESTVTEVLNNVDILVAPARTAQPAKTNDLFKTPDLLRTGPASRAELTAPDNTITRVGANTVFSFAASGRELDLEQGSVLFHSPAGKGGGTIKSGGASAAVTGTTLIVVAIPGVKAGDQNGFKVIMLEGNGEVRLHNGRRHRLKGGEMIYILPNLRNFGPVLTINLLKLVEGSALVHGFERDLPSFPLIQAEILRQQNFILNGGASDTGETPGAFLHDPGTAGNFHFGGNAGDPGSYQIAIFNTGMNYGNGPSLPGYVPPVLTATPEYTYSYSYLYTYVTGDGGFLQTTSKIPNYDSHLFNTATTTTTTTKIVYVPTYFPPK
jgi:hypothetical protein